MPRNIPRNLTIINDEPVDALWNGDVKGTPGCNVVCSRCGAHSTIVSYCNPETRLFEERCSYCGARLRYPDGASW